MNRAWYVTLEHVKRNVKVDDALDDETYRVAIQAASDAMPGLFFVQERTVGPLPIKSTERLLLKGMDLLSVTSLEISSNGTSWQAWSASDYILEPVDAAYQMPPRPYWAIRAAPGKSFPQGGSVRIAGQWGVYDVRKLLPVTLVPPADVDEVQALTPSGVIDGGTFTLTFEGDETAPIAWDADASDIQAALEALPSIGAGNIAGTGGPISEAAVTLTFQGALAASDQSQIAVGDLSLTGTSPDIVASTTQNGSAAGPVSAGATVLTATAAGQIETGHTFRIDAEQIFVTAVDDETLTVERGVNGTMAAEHDGSAPIEIYTYPSVDQATLFLVNRYARTSKDAPFGMVGTIDGFMRLAVNDPNVLGLIGKFVNLGVA